ncbi:MAG: DUF6512 family protein [Bacilli bacterium]
MNLFKTRIIAIVLTFFLSFISHFLYEIFPNQFFLIFFPVNESIWEHMKMLYTTILLYGIFDYLVLLKYNIKFNNFMLSLIISSVLSISIYLSIYLPHRNFINDSMIIILFLLLVVIIIIEVIKYFILKFKRIKYETIFSTILIIIIYIVMGYLTYHPILNFLFLDPLNNTYGLNYYKI